MIIKAILVMLATMVTDLFWTLYVTNASAGNKWAASLYSTCIILFGSYSVSEYVDNRIMVIPAAIGAFLGTMIPLSMKRDSK